MAISSPADMAAQGGRFAILFANLGTTVPIHLELRSVWTGIDRVSYVSPAALYLISNTQTFGGSHSEVKSTVLILSGQNVAIPAQIIAGSALQVVVMPACATGVALSGILSLWEL